MIVCHCRGVTDRAIRDLLQKGACSTSEVAEGCAAGRFCGGCRPTIERLVSTERQKSKRSPAEHVRTA